MELQSSRFGATLSVSKYKCQFDFGKFVIVTSADSAFLLRLQIPRNSIDHKG